MNQPSPDQQCTAHRSSGGEQCKGWRVRGTKVCRTHGGMAPQVRAAGERRVEEEKARKAFGRIAEHATPVEDPFEALAQLTGEIVAWKDFCAGRIEELAQLDYTDARGIEETRALVALFERSLDRAVTVLTAYSKLNIEDRMSRVEAAKATVIIRAVEAGFDELGIRDQAQRQAALAVVGRTMKAIR